jgi:hypothetical protein
MHGLALFQNALDISLSMYNGDDFKRGLLRRKSALASGVKTAS